MPRPTNKTELLNAATTAYADLMNLLASFSETERESRFRFDRGNKDISDVIAHLWSWHKLFQEWYAVGMKGEKPQMPAKGYSWKTTPALNSKLQEENRSLTLDESLRKLAMTHSAMLEIIKQHSDEELFTKKRFAWTGSTSLGAYLTSATSSHYQWAGRLLKKHQRTSEK